MDTTVKKIDSRTSPRGPEGQLYLASGTHLAMRLWREEPGEKKETVRDYETVGFVLRGSAELVVEGQTVRLAQGDSWLVPKNARHTYRILESFEAVEATAPPSHVHGREENGGDERRSEQGG
jgi:quercetin dioxygenase-like cupin family protein